MKSSPVLLNVPAASASSFDIRHEKTAYFANPWHYHPELELALVMKSNGIRFVGDAIEPFGAGDLVLLGPYLPHYWRNALSYYQQPEAEAAEAIILRFRSDFLGKPLWELPELRHIRQLVQQADYGLHFEPDVAAEIQPELQALVNVQGAERIAQWLRIFEKLAHRPHRQLSRQKYVRQPSAKRNGDRISRVMEYLQEHLTQPISVSDVAQLSCMNEAAFCRYFKAQTGKTFVQLLTELRVATACRRLMEGDAPVAEIAYESGFESIPHFNLQFKRITGFAPTQYRTLHQPTNQSNRS